MSVSFFLRPGVNITPTKASDSFPVAKVAELKKLKTVTGSERSVLGTVISNVGVRLMFYADDLDIDLSTMAFA